MSQIIMNLGANAAHAMQEQGGVLTISLAGLDLDSEKASYFHELGQGSYVALSVSDTGQGIAPEIMSRIFDPYFTTKEVGTGTGMGLAVVHGIVKSHGGTVRVHSEAGKGTTVLVLVPALDDVPSPEQEEKPAVPAGMSGFFSLMTRKPLLTLVSRFSSTSGTGSRP